MFDRTMGIGSFMGNVVSGAGTGALAGSLVGGVGAIPGAIIGGVGAGITGAGHLGKSHYEMQGLLAKMKDINNLPPSLNKQGGNTFYDFGNDLTGIFLVKQQIKLEYIAQLADYFKMFGYKINKKRTPDFKSREHFNFIKTVGVTILGNCPQNDLNDIKAMFDNGVTVWHVDDVGNYNLDNNEV